MLFDGEESMLNPSHQIYLAGCNLKCSFCSVEEWNRQPQAAPVMDIQALAAAVDLRRRQGARTLNILGGEPAVSVHGVLELLATIDPSTTVVWNSNMYYNTEVAEALKGLVDIYLADLKCGNDQCAMSLLGVPDYLCVVKQNILQARPAGTVIVRHLLLPGHMDCCVRPILAWLAEQAPGVMVSLRGTYVPPAVGTAAPAVYLDPQELALAQSMASDLGLRLIQ
jgi:putative pyruvate formate lyase activating enzyme